MDRHRRHYSFQSMNLIEQGKGLVDCMEFTKASQIFQHIIDFDSSNPEALFHRSVCAMHKGQFQAAILGFLKVIKKDALFDKQAYKHLAACYLAINDYSKAVKFATRGLSRFPKFCDGYVLRGQIYLSMDHGKKAVRDFKTALKLDPSKGQAFLGLSQCMHKEGNIATALALLQKATSFEETQETALREQAKILSVAGNNKKAMECLQKCVDINSSDPETFFEIGLVHFKCQELEDAILSFEQSIKYDKFSYYKDKAIFYIGASKIKEKDFYGAIHTFNRVDMDSPELKLLRKFAESVILLMKKKHEESITAFTELLGEENFKEYADSCFSYRAYGYTASGMHEKALNDYKKPKNLDKASEFNRLLSLSIHQKDKTIALTLLRKASTIFPSNISPLVYQSCIHKVSDLALSESLLTQAISLKDTDSDLFFYRSIIKYLQAKYSEAVEDATQAIEKDDDNKSEHYLLKGLSEACSSQYIEAFNSFSIVIQLSPKTKDIFYYRGKAALLIGNAEMAYKDFQQLLVIHPNDPKMHYRAGALLMYSGSYEEAIQACLNADSIKLTSESLHIQIKAFILLEDIESVNTSLAKLYGLTKTHEQDREISGIIKDLFSNLDYQSAIDRLDSATPGHYFDKKYNSWVVGVLYFYIGDYASSLEHLKTALEGWQESDDGTAAEEESCELLYNIALCYLPSNPAKSLGLLRELSESLYSSHRKQIELLISVIEGNFKGEETVILPLNSGNTFASHFPLLELPIESPVMIRPSINLPRVKSPDFSFEMEAFVTKYFTKRKISPKPEAPWLNRVSGSIQFTSN